MPLRGAETAARLLLPLVRGVSVSWFAGLKLDLYELAEHPTDYGQEEHSETHAQALEAIVALVKAVEAAQAHAEACCVGRGITREQMDSHARLCDALEDVERVGKVLA